MSLQDHREMFDRITDGMEKNHLRHILDAGSGATSLTLLLETFRDSWVDAVCFPGDTRKTESIKERVKAKNYELLELDLCVPRLWKTYDIVLAHLLLGEAIKFGNTVEDLVKALIGIRAKELIIIDLLEDPDIIYNKVQAQCAEEAGYLLAKTAVITKSTPIGAKGNRYYGLRFQLPDISPIISSEV